MVLLARLDSKGEAQLQALERETGAWLVAYAREATSESPPAYAVALQPAELPEPQLAQLHALELQTGTCIVAYRPVSTS